MPAAAYLRPTALQQLRGFLHEHGAALEPWSGAEEVLDRLVSLLQARRDDPAFFARLAPFLEELRAGAARGETGLPAPDAETLSRATVESVIEELQETLRAAPANASPSLLRSLLGERAAPLLCLALLSTGLSACTQRPDPEPSAEPGVPAPPPPTPLKAPEAAASPDAAASTDALIELFREKSPQEAAKALEQILDAGTPPDLLRRPKTKPPPLRQRDLGRNSVMLYKGVAL